MHGCLWIGVAGDGAGRAMQVGVRRGFGALGVLGSVIRSTLLGVSGAAFN